jgi:hypothetical protein
MHSWAQKLTIWTGRGQKVICKAVYIGAKIYIWFFLWGAQWSAGRKQPKMSCSKIGTLQNTTCLRPWNNFLTFSLYKHALKCGHFIILPFCYFAILQFWHFTILSFQHSLGKVAWASYSTLLDATWRYLTLLDATWRYLMLLDATWRYLTLLDAIRRYSTLIDATRCYSTLFDAIRRYSTLLDTTRHY